ALPSNRHPVFVLHLSIPGELVDVNVHPQKREVRLRQEQTLKEMIIHVISHAFHHEALSQEAPQAFAVSPMPSFFLPEQRPFIVDKPSSFEFERPMPPQNIPAQAPIEYKMPQQEFLMEMPAPVSSTRRIIIGLLSHY